MPDSNAEFEINIEEEKQRIKNLLFEAAKNAPSLKEYRKYIKRMVEGKASYDEISKQENIVLFDNPHLYGIALGILDELWGNLESNYKLYAFDHELDHLNTAKEYDYQVETAIIFGADEKRFQDEHTVSFGSLEFTPFVNLKAPDYLTKQQKIAIDREIISSPKDLSWGDQTQLKKK